ncbi:hypothetical protein, partial [Escherichia coli]|uniref:hypothetical protein n=1 Tax=Escherichia coli TaxID=562 RepID=UPI001BAF907A
KKKKTPIFFYKPLYHKPLHKSFLNFPKALYKSETRPRKISAIVNFEMANLPWNEKIRLNSVGGNNKQQAIVSMIVRN